MSTDNVKYRSIDTGFRSVFQRLATLLSDEAMQNVEHYVEVEEIEMACESLVLSLIKEQVPLLGDVRGELSELCVALRLDKESVFCADFWREACTLFDDPKPA